MGSYRDTLNGLAKVALERDDEVETSHVSEDPVSRRSGTVVEPMESRTV